MLVFGVRLGVSRSKTVSWDEMVCGANRVQEVLGSAEADPSMNGALPPGAWWEAASRGTAPPPAEPYGPHAGLVLRFSLAWPTGVWRDMG